MWLRKLTLQNWSGYEDVNLSFAPYRERKNVVLIGAENGVGKTRLLEAATLCLFGAEGVGHLNRGQSAHRYAPFLTSAFRRNASASCAIVGMTFDSEDANGKAVPVSVERKWHFNDSRQYSHESVTICKDGVNIISGGGLQDKADKIRDFIAEEIMPSSLIPFFFFDSDRVQKLAQREMTSQVKEGIEQILGAKVLRQLIRDLAAYSDKQKNRIGRGVSDEKINSLLNEIDGLQEKIGSLASQIKELDSQRSEKKQEISRLLDEFEKTGAFDAKKHGELQQQIAEKRQQKQVLADSIETTLLNDVPLAIAARSLGNNAAQLIRREIKKDEWENGKKQGEGRFQKFLDNLGDWTTFNLPLSEQQIKMICDRIKQAWDNIWYPMPSDCAREDEVVFSVFTPDQKTRAVGGIDAISRRAIDISAKLAELKRLGDAVDTIQGAINQTAKFDRERGPALREQIDACERKMDALARKMASMERQKTSLEGDLHAKQTERDRALETITRFDYEKKHSAMALNVVELVEEIIRASYPLHIDRISEAMTSAYRWMARNKDVTQIIVTEKADVQMCTESGKDTHDIELSHGESQIFTLALIAAIVKVSGKKFPFIIDTPLGNLDSSRREEFLKYYAAQMGNQIILLSTDTEVKEHEYRLLADNISCKMLLEIESTVDGIQKNRVIPDTYFYG